MRAAFHVRLRGIQIARLKVEKITSPPLSVSAQAPSMYFLSPDSTLRAVQPSRHFVEHRLAQVLGCPNRFKQMSGANP